MTIGKATGRSLDANLDWLVAAQSTRSRPPADGSSPTGVEVCVARLLQRLVASRAIVLTDETLEGVIHVASANNR